MFRQCKACPEPVEWIESNSLAHASLTPKTIAKLITIAFRIDRISRPLSSAKMTRAILWPRALTVACRRGGTRVACEGVAAGTAAATDAAMPETKSAPPNHRIRGVLAPVVTPFKADLSPDCERFVRHCQWLLSQNCGLAPFGTTSEANSMSADERMKLLDAVVSGGIDASRMMPGTGCCSKTETVQLTKHEVQHGCAGLRSQCPIESKECTSAGH